MAAIHYKEKLIDRIAGETSSEETRSIDVHMEKCVDCRNAFIELTAATDLVRSLDHPEPSNDLWHRISNEMAEPRRRAFSFNYILAGSLAAAGIILALISASVFIPRFFSTTEMAGMRYETIEGTPLTANEELIAVGGYMETDASSRAKITVADIGYVEVAPNSRLQLIRTDSDQHRLSLERGSMYAKIVAPPRLFVVDTPSAQAVDLGCEYTLDVDRRGNNTLKVLTGFVSLEDGSRESIVPAGVSCLTIKGNGIGTPYATGADERIKKAIHKFDFEKGGDVAVDEIIRYSTDNDIITLWHLISRVGENKRAQVIEQLSGFVPFPDGVDHVGLMRLDRSMLENWRLSVEQKWFTP